MTSIVTFEDEYSTSQKIPILGHETYLSGDNRIWIKYCREVDVHINRDIMTAENMAAEPWQTSLSFKATKYAVRHTVK